MNFRRLILVSFLCINSTLVSASDSQLVGQSAHINCPYPDTEVTVHGSASPSLPILEILRCGEQITVSGKEGGWYKVHTQSGKDGYVRGTFVEQESPASSEETSSVVKEIPADTVLKMPSRIPVATTRPKPSRSSDDAHPISLRVIQTEQVPYTLQYRGGQVSTSCAINGTTNTNGTAIASGNVAFGNATSVSNLSMNCNSYQTPPMGWRHVRERNVGGCIKRQCLHYGVRCRLALVKVQGFDNRRHVSGKDDQPGAGC
jgi:hypothetical protein